jgi:high-affinity iron transporter
MKISEGLTIMLLACWGCNDPPAERAADPASIARGRELYVQNCALCHGMRADGRGVRKSGLVGKPVDFTSRGWRMRSGREQTERVIRAGKQGTSMAAWKALGADAIGDLASYVLSVSEAAP